MSQCRSRPSPASAFAGLVLLFAAAGAPAQDGGSGNEQPPGAPPAQPAKTEDGAPGAEPAKPAAETPAAEPARPPAALALGAKLEDTVKVTPAAPPEGGVAEPVALRTAVAGEQPLVVVFWSTSCPVCRRYGEVYQAIVRDFRKDARFVAVFPASGEDAAAATRAAKAAGIEAVALDGEQAAATALGVRVTPTVLVFDTAGALRYRGPVDDDRRAKNREPVQHLRDALAAVTSGRQVEGPEPRPFGCALRRKPKKTD